MEVPRGRLRPTDDDAAVHVSGIALETGSAEVEHLRFGCTDLVGERVLFPVLEVGSPHDDVSGDGSGLTQLTAERAEVDHDRVGRPEVVRERTPALGRARVAGHDVTVDVGGHAPAPAESTQARRSRTRHFDVKVQTDAVRREGADQDFYAELVLRASAPRPGSRVRYTLGDVDVTRAMRAEQGLPAFSYSFAPPVLNVHVTARPGAAIGSRLTHTISATWADDRILVDRVKAVVRVVR